MGVSAGPWHIDDTLTFTVNTHNVATGAGTDADAVPAYRVYEDETATAILTGNMAKLDDANTVGFYSEQLTLSAANGFEAGKSYSIYVAATVNSVAATQSFNFKVVATLALEATAQSILTDTAEIGAAGAGLTNINLPNQTMDIVGNITGNLSGSVGSVTGAVGSVTGNVGGNVVGSVASVTAGVTLAASAVQAIWDALTSALTTAGSIGKLLVDNVNATIGSRSTHAAADVWSVATRLLTAGTNIVLAKGTGVTGFTDLSAAQVNAEVVDALNVDTYAEPGQGAPGATISLAAKIGYLWKLARNKSTVTATEHKIFADDGTTVDHKRSVADDGTTFTSGEVSTGP